MKKILFSLIFILFLLISVLRIDSAYAQPRITDLGGGDGGGGGGTAAPESISAALFLLGGGALAVK